MTPAIFQLCLLKMSLSTDMVQMQRLCTSWARWSRGATRITPGRGNWEEKRRPRLSPASCCSGGLCTAPRCCPCWSESMETSPSTPAVRSGLAYRRTCPWVCMAVCCMLSIVNLNKTHTQILHLHVSVYSSKGHNNIQWHWDFYSYLWFTKKKSLN